MKWWKRFKNCRFHILATYRMIFKGTAKSPSHAASLLLVRLYQFVFEDFFQTEKKGFLILRKVADFRSSSYSSFVHIFFRVKTRENQRILDEYYGVFSGTTDYSKTMTEAGYEADNEGKTSSQNKSFDCDHTSELRGIKKQLLSIAELIDYKTSIETSPNANDKEKSIIQHRSHVYEQDSESSDSEKNFDNSEELNKYREVDDEPNDYSYSELD